MACFRCFYIVCVSPDVTKQLLSLRCFFPKEKVDVCCRVQTIPTMMFDHNIELKCCSVHAVNNSLYVLQAGLHITWRCRPSWISKIVWSGPRETSVSATSRRKSILIPSTGLPPCKSHQNRSSGLPAAMTVEHLLSSSVAPSSFCLTCGRCYTACL